MYYVSNNILIQSPSSMDILEHYGVKGMKWGRRNHQKRLERIRKRSTELRAKNGDKLYLENRTALSQRFFTQKGGLYKNYSRLYNDKGEHVGELGYGSKGILKSRKYGTIDWNGVREPYRGKGYSQAAFNEVENRLRKKGAREIRLQSVRKQDARHIYDKNGYVPDKRVNFTNVVSRVVGLDPMVKKIN